MDEEIGIKKWDRYFRKMLGGSECRIKREVGRKKKDINGEGKVKEGGWRMKK